MPQEAEGYKLIIGEDSWVVIKSDALPEGFDTLNVYAQDSIAWQLYKTHFEKLQEAERPATFKDFAFPLIFLFVFALIVLWIAKGITKNPKLYDNVVKLDGKPNPHYGHDRATPDYLTITGRSFKLKDEEYNFILNKYAPYYNTLNEREKGKFVNRVKDFIKEKIFFIHDTSGFREMPVLISASAVQLTFGLDKYLLPAYPHIHIHPQEFLRTDPSICYLVGSVSGHSIYISWKHFLIGSNIPGDGQHVGLHELAHAYHCQNIEKGVNVDSTFLDYFHRFNDEGAKVYAHQQMPGNDFYSEYAMKDFQEFWAETIEIYFERPLEMRKQFPELYSAVSEVLNQDHAARVESRIA